MGLRLSRGDTTVWLPLGLHIPGRSAASKRRRWRCDVHGLVSGPNDLLVFGRATALAHVPSRDDAAARDIRRRPWKREWPHYARVYGAEFVAGPVANGIALSRLMD